MANVTDFCEPGPLLNDEVIKPSTISKATVQRCISKLSPYWSDDQLDQVVEVSKPTGFFDQCLDLWQRPTSNTFTRWQPRFPTFVVRSLVARKQCSGRPCRADLHTEVGL